jgi:hypothetical protein
MAFWKLQDLNIWTTAMQDSILGCAPQPPHSSNAHSQLSAPTCLPAAAAQASHILVSKNWCMSGPPLPQSGLRLPQWLANRLTSLPYNTGGAGDQLDGMVLTPYTLPGQAYSEYNLGLS